MKKLILIALLFAAVPVYAQTVQGTVNTWFNPSSGAPNAGLTSQSPGVPGTVAGYQPLEPLKGTFDGTTYKNFADYLNTIYKLSITIGALIAVVMLVTGGVRYMLSESFTDKSKAKSRIINALWGLTILIGSFLILYTINPNLLNFNLLLPTVNQQASQFGVANGGTNTTNTPTTAQQLDNYAPGTVQGTATGDQMRAANQLLGNSSLASDKYILFNPNQLSSSQLNTVVEGYKDYCERSGIISTLSLGTIHYNTQTVPGSVFGASDKSALVCTSNNL